MITPTKLQNGIWAPSPSEPTPPPTTTYQQGTEHVHGSGSCITVPGRHQQSSIGSGLRRSVCKTWMHRGGSEYVTFPQSFYFKHFYSFLPFLGWGSKSSLGLAEPSRVWQLKELRNLHYSPQTPPPPDEAGNGCTGGDSVTQRASGRDREKAEEPRHPRCRPKPSLTSASHTDCPVHPPLRSLGSSTSSSPAPESCFPCGHPHRSMRAAGTHDLASLSCGETALTAGAYNTAVSQLQGKWGHGNAGVSWEAAGSDMGNSPNVGRMTKACGQLQTWQMPICSTAKHSGFACPDPWHSRLLSATQNTTKPPSEESSPPPRVLHASPWNLCLSCLPGPEQLCRYN